MIRALPLAALLVLLDPVLGPYWSTLALLTWAAVRTGLRAVLNLRGDLREGRIRARLRREIEKADEERAIGSVEMVRPGLLPYPRDPDRVI
ncbi:MAG: hypothetical protein KC466_18855 [Myxococcales bacterium]|nr:hypothetical protein [Myxococcales bacterium]